MYSDLVSVIIPAFNTEKFIEECVNSVITQSYDNIEIIIIDDGSTDNTGVIIKSLQKKDKRIKTFFQKNSGVNIARKKVIELSTGKYVMFLDSDDWIDENTIQELICKTIEKKVDIIKFSMIKEPSKKIMNICNKDEILIQKKDYSILYEMFLKTYKLNSICSTFMKKELLDLNACSLNTDFIFAEDFLINIDLINKSNSIIFLNKPFYHYRLNLNSTTRKRDENRIISNSKNAFYSYSELLKYVSNWNIDIKDVEFKILKEVCVELAKLKLCKISKKKLCNLYKDFFLDIKLHDKLKFLTEEDVYARLNTMNIKDRIQYKKYIVCIFRKKYSSAISRLNIFKFIHKII